mmetsp:Transcript_4185/g.7100  ORF Transcript_4185/g.7100 Transcript_4185/m.7100 type:complete len:228 (-) Transcript_4185:41-724(-)
MRKTDPDSSKYEDEFLFDLCQLIVKFGEPKRVTSILEKVVQGCVSDSFVTSNKTLCNILSNLHSENELHSKAYMYSLRAGNLESSISSLKQMKRFGYDSEQDLFVVRLCFEVLIRNREDNLGCSQVPKILAEFSELKSPLVNFVRMILDAMELKDFELFRSFLGHYKVFLERDPKYYEYLDRIANYYFDGQTIRQANPMQQMLKNMMGGGAGGANPLSALLGGRGGQ